MVYLPTPVFCFLFFCFFFFQYFDPVNWKHGLYASRVTDLERWGCSVVLYSMQSKGWSDGGIEYFGSSVTASTFCQTLQDKMLAIEVRVLRGCTEYGI